MTTEAFVIRNQLGHYWGKSKAWVDGREPRTLMRAKHRDEASNTLFELSSKDIELRGEILPVELTGKGDPIVEVSDIPLPVDPAAELEAEEQAADNEEAPAGDAATAESGEDQPAEDVAH